jgi:hypothetical protein
LTLVKEEALQGVNLTVDGMSSLDIANGQIGTLALGKVKLNESLNMSADVDLANTKMDRLSAVSVDPDSTGTINVNKLHLMSATTAKSVSIPFADENVAGYVRYTGQNKIAYSKIFKYVTTYNSENGYFTFVRGSSGNHTSYNPSVFAGQVSQLAGQYGALTETFNIAFEHSDMYMNMPRDRRKAEENKNRYAFDSSVALHISGRLLNVPLKSLYSVFSSGRSYPKSLASCTKAPFTPQDARWQINCPVSLLMANVHLSP